MCCPSSSSAASSPRSRCPKHSLRGGAKLFLLWSPYHFSAQSLGITFLYARRHNFPLDNLTRKCLWVFIFGSFLTPSLAAEVGASMQNYYGIDIPRLGIPKALATAMNYAMLAAGFGALLLIVRIAWKNHTRIPLLVLAPESPNMSGSSAA